MNTNLLVVLVDGVVAIALLAFAVGFFRWSKDRKSRALKVLGFLCVALLLYVAVVIVVFGMPTNVITMQGTATPKPLP